MLKGVNSDFHMFPRNPNINEFPFTKPRTTGTPGKTTRFKNYFLETAIRGIDPEFPDIISCSYRTPPVYNDVSKDVHGIVKQPGFHISGRIRLLNTLPTLNWSSGTIGSSAIHASFNH